MRRAIKSAARAAFLVFAISKQKVCRTFAPGMLIISGPASEFTV
jgi:hypothetical protein